ncbi:MAG: 50S ribosomal protein L18 [Bdellovibrionales bacterium RIFOXYD1_FULL_53_11]|nr:MAG: 50S ribosomal protein L18 [Bdellovibrionales bacterium RIFOXYD1_FULL_53_11]
MATKIRKKTCQKQTVRFKRKLRIRSRVEGNLERPRMSVFRSNKQIYVQLVDDVKGHTLVSASTIEEAMKGGKDSANMEGAKKLGALVAKRALAKNISKIVFDRSGYLYHGRLKALADAAREAGLKF